MEPIAWTCPYCGRHATVGSNDIRGQLHEVRLDTADGPLHLLLYEFIRCPNPECKKFTLTIQLFRAIEQTGPVGTMTRTKAVGNPKIWRLVPPSEARVFPDYIPKPIRDDYLEACLIRDYSPKASATLARRCLQGMIRDFWGVRKARLIDEIEAIKDKTDPLTWKAIDAVRKIGNIGAHMEQDVNVVIDVEPEEAKQLIWLIETLLHDWYIIRREREERLKGVGAIAETKEKKKSTLKPDRESASPEK